MERVGNILVRTAKRANFEHQLIELCDRFQRQPVLTTGQHRSNGHQAQPADPEEPLPQGLVCAFALHMRKLWLTIPRQRYVRVHFDQVNPLSLR